MKKTLSLILASLLVVTTSTLLAQNATPQSDNNVPASVEVQKNVGVDGPTFQNSFDQHQRGQMNRGQFRGGPRGPQFAWGPRQGGPRGPMIGQGPRGDNGKCECQCPCHGKQGNGKKGGKQHRQGRR